MKSIGQLIVQELFSYYFFIIIIEFSIEIWNGLYMYGIYQLLRNLFLVVFFIYDQFSNQ